jgi:hypothetical protein
MISDAALPYLEAVIVEFALRRVQGDRASLPVYMTARTFENAFGLKTAQLVGDDDLEKALESLVSNGILERHDDGVADPYYSFDDKQFSEVLELQTDPSTILFKIQQLGEDWLKSAFKERDRAIRSTTGGLDAVLIAHDLDVEQGISDAAIQQVIPASDRIVSIDHNKREYQEVRKRLDELIISVEEDNSTEGFSNEDKEQHLAELRAGRELLQATKVSVSNAVNTFKPALTWVGAAFAGGLIGSMANSVWGLIAKLLGIG